MIDKKLYWSLEDGEIAPTKKTIKYAEIVYPQMTMKLAIGVYDNDKFTPLHENELNFHKQQGAKINALDRKTT